jgi:hypothetical protein
MHFDLSVRIVQGRIKRRRPLGSSKTAVAELCKKAAEVGSCLSALAPRMRMPGKGHTPLADCQVDLLQVWTQISARTAPMSRYQLVRCVLEAGWTYQQAADGSGVSRRTAANWVRRFRPVGIHGLADGASPSPADASPSRRPTTSPALSVAPATRVTRVGDQCQRSRNNPQDGHQHLPTRWREGRP